MAVNKMRQTTSTVEVEEPTPAAGASAPAGSISGVASAPLPLAMPARDSAVVNRLWRLRTLRLGFALLICFEIIYLLIDARWPSSLAPVEVLSLHVLMVVASVLILALSAFGWFETHWRKFVFGTVVLMFAVTADLSLITNETEALFTTVVLGLVGAAALMPWSTRWQGALTIAGVAAMAVPTLALQPYDAPTAYHWFGILMAAALAHFIIVLNERHHFELAQWTESVEAGNQRLRQSEAELRKVLEASGDAISISRLSDGHYIDFNRCFCEVTGYTREEALGRSAVELGVWPDRDSLRQFLRLLRTDGRVRNLDCTFRTKSGALIQCLLSASVMELDGEICAVSAARDVTELKRTEQELRVAHHALSSQVGALNESRGRLRTEIAERELAQQRVIESEATLRRIFAANPDIIGVNRLSDGRFVEVNDEFVRVTGYGRAEATAANARQLRLFNDHGRLRELMRILRSEGFVRNFEMELRTKDGALIPHLFSATVINLAGEPCIISFLRDIGAIKQTEDELRATQRALSAQVEALNRSQKQLRGEIAERTLAQQQLQASETKLRRIFETSVDGITISRFPDRHIIDCNPEFLALTRLDREEALSLSVDEMGVWHNRQQYREFMRQLGEHGFVRGMEVAIRRRDGAVNPFLVSASLTEIDGQSCVVSVGRDMKALKETEHELRAAEQALSAQIGALHYSEERLHAEIAERERAQRRLTESERKFRRVFESSLDAIALVDVATWRIVDCNSELTRVAGRDYGQIVGRTTGELNIWTSRRTLHEVTQLLLDMGMVRNLEVEFRHSSGTSVPYLFSAVVAEIDERPCVLAFARDISRLKRTERELIAAREAALTASRAKSEFLSSMSHEIRTPMNAILGMADLLWETALDGEQRRYLHTMRANGDALLSLVNDILDLAKVESGRLKLERSECDVVELAEGVIETLAIRAHEKGLELALRIQPDVPVTFLADSLRLRQVLINLLGNAIKFTERGEATLTIEAGAPAQQAMKPSPTHESTANGATPTTGAAPHAEHRLLRFAVRDTGIGIAAQKIESMFASFTQADSTTTRKYGGSGLGLAIVKRLVDLMGGQLSVESHPGQGSTFSFVAPFEVQPDVPIARNRTCGLRSLAGTRLLVADDSPASREILCELLVMGGAAVTAAGDGAAAIAEIECARAAGRPYDVVLADCAMPPPDGVAIGRHLRAASGAAHEALVLMLTADDLPARLSRLRELGFAEIAHCRHLIKPIRRADLFSIVAAARADAAHDGTTEEAYRSGSANGMLSANGSAAFPPPSVPMQSPADGTGAPAGRPRRILLAEDSPDNRLVIEAYLKKTSYIIDHVENGQIAVRRFIAGSYDAVLMDIQMPVMDGYTAAAEIRRWERENHRPPTPIIALTASADNKAVRKSLEMGCDAHVTKPVKRATLIKAIEQAVDPCGPGEPTTEGKMSISNEPPASQKSSADRVAKDTGATPGDAAGPIVVHIDEELSDLVPGFLDRKRQDAATILAAAERGEGEAISRLGHKLKGEGGGYGLDAISDLGRKLEQAAGARDFEVAAALGRELVSFIDRLEIIYQPMED